LDRISQ
jgi:hypothetical protein